MPPNFKESEYKHVVSLIGDNRGTILTLSNHCKDLEKMVKYIKHYIDTTRRGEGLPEVTCSEDYLRIKID